MKPRLRLLRIRKAISIRKLSRITNIHYSTITKCENGERVLTLGQAIKLADYFGVTIDFLLHRDGIENKKDMRFTGLLHQEIYNKCALLKREELEILLTLIHTMLKDVSDSDENEMN